MPPGWDEWYAFSGHPRWMHYEVNENGELRTYRQADKHETYYLRNRAEAFVRDHAQGGEPWFAMVATHAPHNPHTRAPEFRDSYDHAKMPMPSSFNEADVTDKPEWVEKLPRMDPSSCSRGGRQASCKREATANTWADRLKFLKSVDVTGTHSPPFAHPSAPASGRRVPISGPPRILLAPFPRIVLSRVCPRGQARTIHTSHTLLRYLAQRRRIRTTAVPSAARIGSANMVGSRREGMLEASHREDMGYGECRPRPALGRTGQPREAGHDDLLHRGGRDPERRRVAGCRMPLFELLTNPVRR